MPLHIEVFYLWILSAASVGFLATLTYVARLKVREARRRRRVARVSAVLVDYFRKTGVDVAVDCISLMGDNRFTAFVESEPMKQFRLSHIIEIALRDHVQKTCALELEKIFWRFPIKVAARDAAAGAAVGVNKTIENADDYINEGLVHYKDLPKFEATEIPWEKFEEASSGQESKNLSIDVPARSANVD